MKIDQFIYEDLTQDDNLRGYGIGNDGNFYNAHGHLIVDGYNHMKNVMRTL